MVTSKSEYVGVMAIVERFGLKLHKHRKGDSYDC